MPVRIDKFIWAVRLYKTRSKATEACRSGRVKLNEQVVRPAKTVDSGDVFSLRKGPITYKFRVLQEIKSRVGAKLVENYIENLTNKEELEKLKLLRLSYTSSRAKGMGRPTKKDRREIESFDLETNDFDSGWDDWDDWPEEDKE